MEVARESEWKHWLQHLLLVRADKLEREALSCLPTTSHLELSMARNFPNVEPAVHSTLFID
jgi:hypothetical protein